MWSKLEQTQVLHQRVRKAIRILYNTAVILKCEQVPVSHLHSFAINLLKNEHYRIQRELLDSNELLPIIPPGKGATQPRSDGYVPPAS